MINREAHVNVYVGPGARPKEGLLLGQDRPRRKGTHQTTLQKRVGIKKEKDRETWKYLRESCCQCIKCSATKLNPTFQLLQPLPTTLGRG